MISPLRAFGTPLVEMIEPMPYAAWQQAFDTEFPHGRRYYWKGNLLRELGDGVFDAAVESGTEPLLSGSMVVFEFYHGPLNRVDPAATAFAHREARYQPIAIAASDDAADDEAGIGWARGLHTAIAPHALNGAFLNVNSLDGAERRERVRAGYGTNWERLVAVKRRYDPTNLFRENNNVVP